LASYLGIAVYMVGLWSSIQWLPDFQLFSQILALTTVQGVIMVAGAVVISSQTTSVRAANLLASFIIVPMALLIQFEAVALFWGNHTGLWWLIVALAMTAAVLVRMGIRLFNREELMGREIDQIRLGWIWQQFWRQYSGRSADGRYPRPDAWYRQTLAVVPQLRLPAVALGVALVGAVLLGIFLANTYRFPPAMQADLTGEKMVANLSGLQFLTGALPVLIFFHNVRTILLLTLVGVFTFGVVGVLIFMLPWGFIGFVATQFGLAGQDPFTFLLATVAPHALIELPALLLAAAAALRWHTLVLAPPANRSLSEGFLLAAADFARVMIGLVVPLLLLAALIEAYVTPAVLFRIYG
jgi:uncharacterized membrane protein SpoIIM required for sporulation